MKFFVILAAIASVLIILSAGYFQKRNKKIKELKKMIKNIDNYDLVISRIRQERSKDSNGNSTVIKLKDNVMYYSEKSWGFKSQKGTIEKEIILDNSDIIYIDNFIKENKLNKNYTKKIEVKKKHSFTTYTYDVTLKFENDYYNINIVSNTENQNLNTIHRGYENSCFGKVRELYDFLKSKVV